MNHNNNNNNNKKKRNQKRRYEAIKFTARHGTNYLPANLSFVLVVEVIVKPKTQYLTS